MPARLRSESGFGLVELLVALTVTSIGIVALVAGLSSGFGAINRASKTSTAGTLADQQMETYRRGSFALIAAVGAPRTGTDGRAYYLKSTVTPAKVCEDGELDTTCSAHGGVVGRDVKTVTITVYEGTDDTGKPLITESSTFDQSTG